MPDTAALETLQEVAEQSTKAGEVDGSAADAISRPTTSGTLQLEPQAPTYEGEAAFPAEEGLTAPSEPAEVATQEQDDLPSLQSSHAAREQTEPEQEPEQEPEAETDAPAASAAETEAEDDGGLQAEQPASIDAAASDAQLQDAATTEIAPADATDTEAQQPELETEASAQSESRQQQEDAFQPAVEQAQSQPAASAEPSFTADNQDQPDTEQAGNLTDADILHVEDSLAQPDGSQADALDEQAPLPDTDANAALPARSRKPKTGQQQEHSSTNENGFKCASAVMHAFHACCMFALHCPLCRLHADPIACVHASTCFRLVTYCMLTTCLNRTFMQP